MLKISQDTKEKVDYERIMIREERKICNKSASVININLENELYFKQINQFLKKH